MIFTSRWLLLSQAENTVSLSRGTITGVMTMCQLRTGRPAETGSWDTQTTISLNQRHILEPAHKLIRTTMKTRPVNCSLLVVVVCVLTFNVLFIWPISIGDIKGTCLVYEFSTMMLIVCIITYPVCSICKKGVCVCVHVVNANLWIQSNPQMWLQQYWTPV